MASRFSASHLRPVKSPNISAAGCEIVPNSSADGSVENGIVLDDNNPGDHSAKIESGLIRQSTPVSEKASHESRLNVWAKQDLDSRLLDAANAAPVGLITIDVAGRILTANKSCKSIIGIPATVLVGSVFSDYLCDESAEAFLKGLSRSMDVVPISGNEVALCFTHHLLSTRSIQATITMSKLTSDGYIEYIIVLLDKSKQRQIEKQLRNSKEYLERLATHDALTGLPNRIHFTDALRAAMLNSRKAKRELALLYFDIDGFKAVNDQHGHHVGDSLLREIANRLRIRTVEVGKLARLGGDEFTMILEHSGTYESLCQEAEKVRQAISEPVHASSKTLHVSASIGIAIYPEYAKTPRQLIQYADTAMYQAKEMGGNCVVKFSAQHQEKLKRTASLENDLGQSIENSDFYLDFQPIISSETGQVDVLEVLIRWAHPEYGVVSPEEFIPIAERSRHMSILGNWIIESTCRVCQQLLNDGIKMRFAINLSPVQLNNSNLAYDIRNCIDKYGLSPDLFDLEITESCVMSDINCALTQINELGEHGFALAVDDFGTGHSSLARLSSLPVSKIKLDRLFISDLVSNKDSRIIVKGFIGIAHELGMTVVAEGVEQDQQLELLQLYGCEYLQGFGILQPCSEKELPGLLGKGIEAFKSIASDNAEVSEKLVSDSIAVDESSTSTESLSLNIG